MFVSCDGSAEADQLQLYRITAKCFKCRRHGRCGAKAGVSHSWENWERSQGQSLERRGVLGPHSEASAADPARASYVKESLLA